MIITFILNDNHVNIDVDPTKPLLRVLREELGVKSIKEGCGRGECGTCTVLLDGKAVTSCMIPVVQVRDRKVVTLDGLENDPIVRDIQRAFIESGSVQCGFCTPGFIISAYALIKNNPEPDRDEIRVAISGNICRCTGYTKIIEGIEKAVEYMKITSSAGKK